MVITNEKPQEYNNFKIPGTGCDLYGKQRLELAIDLHDNVLPNIKQPYFIENGTLLGAWRNRKFIKHDDDFDYGILIEDEIKDKNIIIEIFNHIKKNLNKKYECRLITTYADKIEVYDPSWGNYKLSPKYEGADYHYVTIDLQFYKRIDENHYQPMYYINPFNALVDVRLILPTRQIMLENEMFPAPFKIREFLTQYYGSLDPKAKYNSETGKYHLL